MAYESKKEQIKNEQEKVEGLLERFSTLASQRSNWEPHWQECYDYALPRKADITVTQTQGSKKNFKLFDTTAGQALDTLASALHGWMTNPSTYFFELTTGDEAIDHDDQARFWLQDTSMRMHAMLNNSNFQTEIHEFYLDLGCPGTANLDTMEDEKYDVRFASRYLQEIYIEENNLEMIDTRFRKYKWKAKQIVQEFGKDKVGKKLFEAYKENPSQEFELLHAIYPRDDADIFDKTGPKNFKFASCTLIIDHKHLLNESGFRELPFAVSRWSKSSGEIYGRSPTMNALPDIKMINEAEMTMIEAAQRNLAPPVQMPDDGFVLPLKLKPLGINYYRSGSNDRIEQIFPAIDIHFADSWLESKRNRIRQCYYVDQLQLPTNGPMMTALETSQRTDDRLKLMGPMLGRQQSEGLKPTLERVYAIGARKKRFLPPPAILQGKNVTFKYSSSIAKAQRQSEASGLQRFLSAIAPIASTDQSVLQNINGDEFLRHNADIFGVPQKVLRNRDEVASLRKAAADAHKQAADAQNNSSTADAIGQVLPAMAKGREAGII